MLEELDLAEALLGFRLRVVGAELPTGLLGEHDVLATLLSDHRITSLRLALQLRLVDLDEGADLVGKIQQLRPLFLVQRDRKAAEPVDRDAALFAHLERDRAAAHARRLEGGVLRPETLQLGLHIVSHWPSPLRLGSDGGADVLVHEADDVLRRGAGREELLHADRLQRRDVFGRDDATAEDHDVLRALFLQELEHPLEQIIVGAGEHAEPDGVGVLLDGGGHDLLGRLVQARVDDLEAGVAQRARHALGAAVVAVEAGLGDDHADGARVAHDAASSASRIRSPISMIRARSPGTTGQSKPLPSLFQRGMRCRWKCGTDWKAAAPLACSTLRPSGLTASRRARATCFATVMAASRSASSASQMVAA